MRKFQVLMVAALMAIATSVTVAQVKGMGRLNGKVIDDGGSPVDGVAIKLRQGTDVIESKTDPKGDWVLAGVARGNWVVTFEKEGFPTKVVKVLVEKELMRTDPIKITMKKGT
jgi:Carboxypeptidase regulatory-like domain